MNRHGDSFDNLTGRHSHPRSEPGEPQAKEADTDEYVSQLQAGQANILVAVRCRPYTKKEKDQDLPSIVQILEDKVVVIQDPVQDGAEAYRVNRTREKQYAFDFAFQPTATQQIIFEKTTSFLLEGVLSGYNATVFAYGPTGAGKTYSMLGTFEHPGLMLNSISRLFTRIEDLRLEKEYTLKLSYLEIYNETIRDLLNAAPEALDIREDPAKGVLVAGLSEMVASSQEQVTNAIRLGNKRRTTEPTLANETSSRSHAVLQIVVEHKDKATGTEAEIAIGKLSLVDLAGSERAANTQNKGQRLIEGANINRSLLALGNCINALCESSEKAVKVFIPYRDSKLTRLLKDSLGGNCRTVMLACISPHPAAYEDTHNTLKYANRAKNIKTSVVRNVLSVSYHISKYTDIIAKLKQEVTELRTAVQNKSKGALPPIVSLEKYQLELNAHFQEEAKSRKRMFEAEQSNEQLSFILFARQTELSKSAKAQTDTAAVRKLKEEIDVLSSTMAANSNTVETETDRFHDLERKRSGLTQSWERANLRDQNLAVLRTMLKQHIMNMSNMDLHRKEKHTEILLRQKEMFIKHLEGQVKVRDVIIDEHQASIVGQKVQVSEQIRRKMQEIQSLSEIAAHSKVSFPDLYSETVVRESQIPRVKLKPQERKQPGRHRHRHRSNSVHSIESETSTASSGAQSEQHKALLRVAEKFRKSPYVARGQSIPPKETGRKQHVDPTRVHYGAAIRRLDEAK